MWGILLFLTIVVSFLLWYRWYFKVEMRSISHNPLVEGVREAVKSDKVKRRETHATSPALNFPGPFSFDPIVVVPDGPAFRRVWADSAFLLVHGGGGGTAVDMRGLAEYLHGHYGVRVHVPLLQGYGTNPEDLRGISPDTWVMQILREYSSLCQSHRHVHVLGHSLGGALALEVTSLLASGRAGMELTAQRGWTGPSYDALPVPASLILIAPAVALRSPPLSFVRKLARFVDSMPVSRSHNLESSNGQWVGYSKLPLDATVAMLEIQSRAVAGLGFVSIPWTCIAAKDDPVVDARKAATVLLAKCHTLGSQQQVVLLPKGGHGLVWQTRPGSRVLQAVEGHMERWREAMERE